MDERVKFELGDSILGGWLLALVSLGSKRIITRKIEFKKMNYNVSFTVINKWFF